MNKKVERMLEATAVLLKDEDPKLIEAMNNMINGLPVKSPYLEDSTDGYPFDFKAACDTYRNLVSGKSY